MVPGRVVRRAARDRPADHLRRLRPGARRSREPPDRSRSGCTPTQAMAPRRGRAATTRRSMTSSATCSGCGPAATTTDRWSSRPGDGQLRFTGHLETETESADIGRLWSVGDRFHLVHHDDHRPAEPDERIRPERARFRRPGPDRPRRPHRRHRRLRRHRQRGRRAAGPPRCPALHPDRPGQALGQQRDPGLRLDASPDRRPQGRRRRRPDRLDRPGRADGPRRPRC